MPQSISNENNALALGMANNSRGGILLKAGKFKNQRVSGGIEAEVMSIRPAYQCRQHSKITIW